MPHHAEVGVHLDAPPARAGGHPIDRGQGFGFDARRPHKRLGDDGVAVGQDHAVAVDALDQRSAARLDAQGAQALRGVVAEALRESGEKLGLALDDHDARVDGDGWVLAFQHEPHQLRERARILDAGWASAHDDERHPRRLLFVRDGGRLLEATENVIAELQRLAQVLEAERLTLDGVVAEEVRAAAGGDHEVVVRNRAAALRTHVPPLPVDADHVGLSKAHVGRPGEHAANRECDVARVQQRARHLIEQRRKHVVVVAVDEEDLGRPAVELFGTRQPAEPRPDDHDARPPVSGSRAERESVACECRARSALASAGADREPHPRSGFRHCPTCLATR